MFQWENTSHLNNQLNLIRELTFLAKTQQNAKNRINRYHFENMHTSSVLGISTRHILCFLVPAEKQLYF